MLAATEITIEWAVILTLGGTLGGLLLGGPGKFGLGRLFKGNNPGHDAPGTADICVLHDRKITTAEETLRHIAADIAEIKADLKRALSE